MSMTTSKSDVRARVRAFVEASLEPDARIIAVWHEADPTPPSDGGIWRAIFVLSAERIASMRHWRDELEDVTPEGDHVVAMEASKVARLLLKGHEPTRVSLAQMPDQEWPEGLKHIVTRKISQFDRIDSWLTQIRRAGLVSPTAEW